VKPVSKAYVAVREDVAKTHWVYTTFTNEARYDRPFPHFHVLSQHFHDRMSFGHSKLRLLIMLSSFSWAFQPVSH
jgi:hypothetical protein